MVMSSDYLFVLFLSFLGYLEPLTIAHELTSIRSLNLHPHIQFAERFHSGLESIE